MLWDWQGETNSDGPLILDHETRRGLNVVLVARDQVALEQLAEEVRGEGVQAKVVVEDFAKEGAVSRVVEKVTNIITYLQFRTHPKTPSFNTRLQIGSLGFS